MFSLIFIFEGLLRGPKEITSPKMPSNRLTNISCYLILVSFFPLFIHRTVHELLCKFINNTFQKSEVKITNCARGLCPFRKDSLIIREEIKIPYLANRRWRKIKVVSSSPQNVLSFPHFLLKLITKDHRTSLLIYTDDEESHCKLLNAPD